MQSLGQALGTFTWFLGQVVPVFAIPLFGLLPAGWALERSSVAVRRRLWWLGLLPGLWVFAGLWGGLFWRDVRYGPPNPSWVLWPVENGVTIFFLIALLLFLSLRGARPFAVAVAVLNLPLMWAMSLMAGMATSGAWL